MNKNFFVDQLVIVNKLYNHGNIMNMIMLKLSAQPPHSVFVPCISIEPGPRYITTEAYNIDIEFKPIKGFVLSLGSLHKVQKINKPIIMKPKLVNVLTGSLKRPPETFSHHLDASPIK